MLLQEPTQLKIKNSPVHFGAATDKGQIRSHNEDACFIAADIPLFIVSDGMGGHRGGQLASRIIIEDLPALFESKLNRIKSESPRAIRNLIKKVVSEQSYQLHMEGNSESGYTDMGATLVLAYIHGQRAYIANLGDSRIYRLRNNQLRQISRDHSAVSELIEEGKLHPDQADDHEEQGLITRYVGMEDKAHAHIRTFKLQPNDTLLLCTDGLTDMLSDDEITAIMTSNTNCQTTADTLVEHANLAGGHDNVTALVLQWLG